MTQPQNLNFRINIVCTVHWHPHIYYYNATDRIPTRLTLPWEFNIKFNLPVTTYSIHWKEEYINFSNCLVELEFPEIHCTATTHGTYCTTTTGTYCTTTTGTYCTTTTGTYCKSTTSGTYYASTTTYTDRFDFFANFFFKHEVRLG